MRLVFLSHDGNLGGGAQQCLIDLLKGLRQTFPEIQLYVIFPYKGSLVNSCSMYIDGYKIIHMSWWLLPNNAQVNLKKKFEFLNDTRKSVGEIMHYLAFIKPNYGITNTIVIPCLATACKLSGIKHVWFIHEIPTMTWSNNRFIFQDRNIYRWINLFSYKVFVTSCYSESYYRHVISTKKIKIVDQAVELVSTSKVDSLSHSRYTLLLIGSFDSNKGQMELLHAINRIVSGGKDVFCYLIGADLGYMAKCRDYVMLHKLEENVLILPFTADVCQYYYLSDVLVNCSTLETFGRTTVEAQKCGLPVILSNVGANSERVLDKVNGLLYEKGDILDLVNKIEFLRDKQTRKSFVDKLFLLGLNKYSSKEFAFCFMNAL